MKPDLETMTPELVAAWNFLLRTPPEPMPAPIKEPPNPPENPDVPMGEPNPDEEPTQI